MNCNEHDNGAPRSADGCNPPKNSRAVQSARLSGFQPRLPVGSTRPTHSAVTRIKESIIGQHEPDVKNRVGNDAFPFIDGAAVDVESTTDETASCAASELPVGKGSSWQMFSDYVKTISVNNMSFESKRMSGRLSDVFRTVRTQFERERENEAPVRTIRRTVIAAVHAKNSLTSLSMAQTTPEVVGASDDKMAARTGNHVTSRGWHIVRKCVEDRRAQNRTMRIVYGEADSQGLRQLVKTVDKVKEAAKTRQHLYERYIYNPNRNAWADGLVNYPQFLLDRLAKTSRGPAADSGARARAPRSAPPRAKRPMTGIQYKRRPASSAVPGVKIRKPGKAHNTRVGIV